MPSPIWRITLRACFLSAVSCFLGQVITSYQQNIPLSLDIRQLLLFQMFTLLNAPPNFLWQSYLERTLPSTYFAPRPSSKSKAEPELHRTNTVFKFLLDNTVGAAGNTLFYLAFFALSSSAPNVSERISSDLRDEFWPMMTEGWKVWPFVSLLNFTVVRSVEGRAMVGGLAGLGWGVWLTLRGNQ